MDGMQVRKSNFVLDIHVISPGLNVLLVSKVYLLSAIDPWSLKWVQLVPNVSKLGVISPSIQFC